MALSFSLVKQDKNKKVFRMSRYGYTQIEDFYYSNVETDYFLT